MKGKPVQNLAASVYARLLKRTEPGDQQFQFVLMRYGAERLMYRLSQSEHAANFVLKGAMMFLVWTGAQYRATKDMDLLALKSASVERLRDIFRELCELPVAQDGLAFEPDSVKAEEIREDNLYQGVRVTLVTRLGKAKVPIQVDIGFGDAVTPKPVQTDFPTLLDFPAPRLAVYPRETVVAEKFEAMVKLGLANSRMPARATFNEPHYGLEPGPRRAGSLASARHALRAMAAARGVRMRCGSYTAGDGVAA